MSHRAIGSWARRTRRALIRGWPLVALLGLTAFCLSPALGTGYWAEDIYYSAMIPAGPILNDSSWFAETIRAVKHSMLVGRFYPITPMIAALAFIVFQDVAAYKAYIIGVTLLDVAIFAALIRRLTGRRGFAIFAAATTVALFQFRLSVDPILAYYAQIQWVIAAFFLSLICLSRYLEDRRPIDLKLSALAYLFCNLSYEMTYTLVLIPLFLIARSRPGWRGVWVTGRPFVASVVFCGGMTALMRWLHPSGNYVHKTEFDPGLMLGSIANQVSAGLPLSYYFGDPLGLFSKGRDLRGWLDWLLQPGVVLVFLGSTALNFRTLRKPGRASGEAFRPVGGPTLVGLGIALATLPAILTAISPHHRAYLSFGVGWIGVMVQYHGVGLLVSLALWQGVASSLAGGSFARWKCLAASALVGGLLGLTFRANIEVATAFNAPPGSDRYRQFAGDHGASWHLHRTNLVAALDSGVMDDVPSGSRVELANAYPYWHDSLYGQFFYAKQTGKRIETFPSQIPTRLPPDAPIFRVRDAVRNSRIGMVLVTASTSAPFGIAPNPERSAPGRVFVRHPGLQPDPDKLPTLLLVGQPGLVPERKATTQGQVFRLGRDLPTLQLGQGWGLFALDPSKYPRDPDSLRLVDDPIQVASWLESIETPRSSGTVQSIQPFIR